MSNDENKYGNKIVYDPLWRGPMQNARYSTDKIWLITFVIYLAIYFSGALYGLNVGNFKTLGAPTDYAGRSCGIDKEVKDKPYLFVLDLKTCIGLDRVCLSPTACVSECPTENFIYKRDADSIDIIKKKLMCTTDVNVSSISTFDQIDKLIFHKKCAKWYLNSEPINERCLAFNAWIGHENETITSDELYNARAAIKDQERFLEAAYDSVYSAIGPASIAIICGGIIALLYVILLKWFAVPFFYASICMFCTFMVYGIYRLCVEYHLHKAQETLIALILLIVLIVLVIIAVIYFRKKIYLACQLIKESSKAVMHLSLTLIFPILPWLLYILVVVFSIAVFMSFITITKSNYAIEKLDDINAEGCKCTNFDVASLFNGEKCDPIVFDNTCKANGQPCQLLKCRLDSKTNPGYLYAFHVINLVGFYWLLFFISGFEYMVLGGTFASWYWSLNKSEVTNASVFKCSYTTIRYHMGTIAIGSLILTISQMIRILLQALQNKCREANNVVAVAFICCFRYFFDLLDSLLNFLNYNAYIMCAIHGKSFCQSAKDAFNLLMRNIVKIVVVDTVADWLFVMAKLLVTSIAVAGHLLYLRYSTENVEENGYFGAGAILTAIGTYLIASVFFSVQSIAVKTIFLCFIEDSERNDGSDARPYYMNDKLKQLLHK